MVYLLLGGVVVAAGIVAIGFARAFDEGRKKPRYTGPERRKKRRRG
jgi:hypothetical protein